MTERFDDSVDLPPGLTTNAIGRSIRYIERQAASWLDAYYEQRNIFSALVGILGTKALDTHSVYEKCRHSAIAQTRFPDLKRRGQPDPPPSRFALESKASIRIWDVQAHYNHAGWYIIWRYMVDPTEELGRSVIVWRVHIIYATEEHWKYEGSSAGEGQGGRTHTYRLFKPASALRNKAVYSHPRVVTRAGKAILENGPRTQ